MISISVKNKKRLLVLGPILLFLWITIVNRFPDGFTYNSGDFSQPLNIESNFKYFFYVWGDRIASPGEGGFLAWFAAIPYYFFFYLLPATIGLSETQTLSFILFFFLIFSYFSFKYAMAVIFKSKNNLFTCCFSLIYSVNQTTLYFFTYTWGFSHHIFLYVTLPVLVARFYLYVKSPSLKTLIIFLLVLLASVSGFTNSAFFLGLFAFLTLFLIGLLVQKCIKFDMKKLFSILTLAVLSLLILSYWLIPTLVFVKEGLVGLQGGVFDLTSWLRFQSADILSILVGFPGYKSFYPFSHDIKVWYLFQFIPILLLGYLLFSIRKEHRSHKKISIIFLTIWILFVIITKKSKPPFGEETLYIFSLPFMPAFRSYEKLALFLPFAFYSATYGLIPKSWTSKLKYNLITLVIVIAPLPFWIGGIQTKYSITIGANKNTNYISSEYSGLVKIPEEYTVISEAVNRETSDSKIQAMPYSPLNTTAWVNYPKWKVIGFNPIDYLIKKTTIAQNSSQYILGGWNPHQEFNNSQLSSEWYIKALSYFNVSHIIYHLDVDEQFIKVSLPKMQQLERQKLISEVLKNEYAILYEINQEFVFQKFYVPRETLCITNDLSSLPYVLSTEDNNYPNQFILNNYDKDPICADNTHVISSLPNISLSSIDTLYWEEGWEWPFSYISADSSDYRKTINKERKDLANNIQKKPLDLQLMYIAKRASELNTVSISTETDVKNEIAYALEQIKNTLFTLSINPNAQTYRNSVKKVITYLVRLDNDYGRDELSHDYFQTILRDFDSWLIHQQNRTCEDICYNIIIPKSSTYDVYIIDPDKFLTLNKDSASDLMPIELKIINTDIEGNVSKTLIPNHNLTLKNNFILFQDVYFDETQTVQLELKFNGNNNQPKELPLKNFASLTILLKQKEKTDALSQDFLKINSEKINPTKYRISVQNATQSYNLVFSEMFHDQWKLYLNENNNDKTRIRRLLNILSPHFISDKKHYLTNGYANAWTIDPSDVDNRTEYELIAEFRPQILFYIGTFVSLSFALICFVVFISIRKND